MVSCPLCSLSSLSTQSWLPFSASLALEQPLLWPQMAPWSLILMVDVRASPYWSSSSIQLSVCSFSPTVVSHLPLGDHTPTWMQTIHWVTSLIQTSQLQTIYPTIPGSDSCPCFVTTDMLAPSFLFLNTHGSVPFVTPYHWFWVL